jgi:hypothetical protein
LASDGRLGHHPACLSRFPLCTRSSTGISNFSVEVLKLQRQRNLAASVFLTQREVDSCRWTAAFVWPSPSCSILLGFLFAGFGWTLNQELTFKVEDWHFKLGIGPAARCYGHAWTIRSCAAPASNRLCESRLSSGLSRGSPGAHHCIWLHADRHGHCGVFKLPKYRTTTERFLFAATLLTVRISSEIDGSSHPKVAKLVAATCQALVTDRLCRAAERCLLPISAKLLTAS